MKNEKNINELNIIRKKARIEQTLIIFSIVVSLTLGFVFGQSTSKTTVYETFQNEGMLGEVIEIISEEWVDTKGMIKNIEHVALDGFVDGLGDPHTEYWTTEMAQAFNQSVSGNYEGIGISYRVVEQGAMVISVFNDTPASNLGIVPGDILTEVDSIKLSSLSSDEIKEVVTGNPGSKINIKYLRGTNILEGVTNRASLDISAQVEIKEVDGKKYGYILLTTFGTNTGKEVANALQMFTEEKIDTLVFDFRNNGGGYLSAAKEIGNLFVNEGTPIYQIQTKDGPAQKTLATAGDKYRFENNYILINESTASASELVAGTLSEVCDFTLLGTTTYGKGTAQTQRELSDGSVLKFTYAQWLTSKGQSIDGIGLKPDIEVNNSDVSNISTAELSKTLSFDSVSTGVISMQNMLNLLGYDVDRKDGYFSSSTELALIQFQKDYNLTPDGIYDNNDHLYLIARTMIAIELEENDNQYKELLKLIR